MKRVNESAKNQFGNAKLNAGRIIALAMAALLLSSGLLRSAAASADSLDASFGQGGKLTTDFFNKSDSAGKLAIQPDGRIVVVGETVVANNTGAIALVRYNPNGSLDTTFGSGGKVTTTVGFSSGGKAVAIQPDGRIVVGGLAFLTSNNASLDFAVVRYKANGSLDASFGNGGIVTTDFFGSQEFISDIVIRPDGRILVTGAATEPQVRQSFAMAQYNPNGSLDPSFGLGGKVVTDFTSFGAGSSLSRALLLQADGRVVVVGNTNIVNTFNYDLAMARYNPNGSLDPTFGLGGKVLTDFFGNEDSANDIALQPDGRYLVAGSAQLTADFANTDFALLRYNSDGSLDPAFGVGGKVITDIRGGSDTALAVALLPNGRILAGGTSRIGITNASQDFALARYDANGNLDPTFGTGGKLLTDFFGNSDVLYDLAVQPDGRYLALGSAMHTSDFDSTDIALVRYFGDLAFDICVQDDTAQTLLQINSQTGDYYFQNCKKGISMSGRGAVSQNGCTLDLTDSGSSLTQFDRSLTAHVNLCTRQGNASVHLSASSPATMITDSNIDNNTGACH